MRVWTCVAVLLLLIACGKADTQDAAQLATEGAIAFEAVESFNFDLQVTNGTSAPLNDISIISAVGEAARPDSLQADIKARLADAPVAVNIKGIIIGTDAWITPNPFNLTVWEKVEGTEGLAAFSPAKGVSDVLNGLRNPEYIGTETIDGAETFHIKGVADTSTLNAITGGVASAGEVQVEVWIGQTDKLVRKLTAVGALDPSEDAEITRTILVNGFNEPVNISAPE